MRTLVRCNHKSSKNMQLNAQNNLSSGNRYQFKTIRSMNYRFSDRRSSSYTHVLCVICTRCDLSRKVQYQSEFICMLSISNFVEFSDFWVFHSEFAFKTACECKKLMWKRQKFITRKLIIQSNEMYKYAPHVQLIP